MRGRTTPTQGGIYLSGKGRPERQQRGFVERKQVRCPACEDREALRNDGGAKVIGGGQLKGSTVDVGVTRASSGCERCRGKGYIPTDDLELMMKAGIENARNADKDPYSYGIKPSAGLLRRKGDVAP